MRTKISILTFILFLWSGCAPVAPEPKTEKKLTDVSYNVTKDGELILEKTYTEDNKSQNEVMQKRSASVERIPDFEAGSLRASQAKKQKIGKPVVVYGKEKVRVTVEEIPANEFIDLVFSKVLNLNYTVTEEVRKMTQPITLNMSSEQSRHQLYEVVDKLLQMNGIQVKKENEVFFLSKKEAVVAGTEIGAYIGFGRSVPAKIAADEKIGLFVPFDYVDPKSIYLMLRSVTMPKASLYFVGTDVMLIMSTAEEVRKALEVIDMLDRSSMKEKILVLMQMDYLDPVLFTERAEEILKAEGIPVAKTSSEIGVRFVPIPEINALLVISPKQSWVDMLAFWKTKLDKIEQLGDEPNLYIYDVKNRRADELAETVSTMLGLAVHTKQGKPAINKDTATTTSKTQQATPSQSSQAQSSYIPSVTPDKATNVLMLNLKPADYKSILPILEKLDVLPLQALVEVTIAEITMTDTFSLGFEWAIRNRGLDVVDTLNVVGGGSGLGVVFQGSKIDSTINAFAEDKLLDIVSKPKLLILNNETGSINVGTQVPIITGESSAMDIGSTAGSPSIMRNVSYRTTGVIVGVTPTINSRGILTMSIDLSLSEAQLNDTSTIDSPLIIDRALGTVAVVRSGDTIMIGGLISSNNSESDGGIPLLKDIPWLGTLFKSVGYKKVKTELIILIRPTIIKTPQEMQRVTRAFKALLQNIRESDL